MSARHGWNASLRGGFEGNLTRRGFAMVVPWILLSMSCLGCGGGGAGGRVPVAGEVIVDGQPLDRGTIEFHSQEQTGELTGGVIRNGRFEIPAAQGAKPGSYEVRIFAAGDSVDVDPNEPPGPEAEGQVAVERIPARYNVQSELSTEIGPKGERELRFELEGT